MTEYLLWWCGWLIVYVHPPQNIHLVAKWLPKLDKKLEQYSEGSHEAYRVYMSAEPAADRAGHIIPQGVLESSIKITNEPPTGMLANLNKAFDNFNQVCLCQVREDLAKYLIRYISYCSHLSMPAFMVYYKVVFHCQLCFLQDFCFASCSQHIMWKVTCVKQWPSMTIKKCCNNYRQISQYSTISW